MTTKLNKVLKSLAVVLVCIFASSANAFTECNVFRDSRDPVVEQKLKNCERIFNSGLVPNKAALAYSIKFMMRNHGGLKDPSCALASPKPTYDCANCSSPEWIEKGVENTCSLVINDLERPWDPKHKGHQRSGSRTTGYFIDLCAKKSKDLVSSFYFNGAPGQRFDDTPNPNDDNSNSSVLAGAFLLDGSMSEFSIGANNTRGQSRYAKIVERNGGVPAIHMVGLNSSNNKTEFNKPIHVSAYSRGLGCPGVSESTIPIMKKIVKNGPSLYMAYAGKQFEQSGDRCDEMKSPSPSAPQIRSATRHPSTRSRTQHTERANSVK